VCYSLPAPPQYRGAPGHGLAVYVRAALARSVRHVGHASDLCHTLVLQLSGCRVLFVDVYMRPSLSMDVAVSSLESHLQQLQVQSTDLLLVGGDFNAALPALDDRPLGPLGVCPLPIPERDLSLAGVGDRAEALLALCHAWRLVALTGRHADVPVATSSDRGQTRVDHVLVSADHFSCVASHSVLDVVGSDHLPLSVHVTLPGGAPALLMSTRPSPLCRRPWCGGCLQTPWMRITRR
jgi:hypothetical protein